MKRKACAGKIFSTVFIVAFIVLLTAAIIPGVMGASAVDIGSAGNFAILAKSGITSTGTTKITGNIGVSPIAGGAMTGFDLIKDSSNRFSTSPLIAGKAYAANYDSPTPDMLITAVSDMETAYASAEEQKPDATELYAGVLGGKTLAPGCYKWSTDVLIPASTTLTLDANGDGTAVWVFQLAGDLTMKPRSQIVLKNGAKAENVYWQIAGPTSVALGPGAHAEGTILSQNGITMMTGASLHGRALAQTAVTLISDTITEPTPITGPSRAPVQTITPQPTPTEFSSKMVTVNVGGNSGVYKTTVLGRGINGLVVTGTVLSGPGKNKAAAPGTVYQYIDLEPAQYTSLDREMIFFTVPPSWLNANQISPQDIVLYQLDGNSWTALPTTFIKNEGTRVYYSAASPEFLRFAIAGQPR